MAKEKLNLLLLVHPGSRLLYATGMYLDGAAFSTYARDALKLADDAAQVRQTQMRTHYGFETKIVPYTPDPDDGCTCHKDSNGTRPCRAHNRRKRT